MTKGDMKEHPGMLQFSKLRAFEFSIFEVDVFVLAQKRDEQILKLLFGRSPDFFSWKLVFWFV
jgi:hypothetical protein